MKRKSFAIYAITRHGLKSGAHLAEALGDADFYVSEKLLHQAPSTALRLPLPLGPTLSDVFGAYDCHIFVISVGAVVRMIAPLLRDKKVDPAVVCVDDAARFAICVLSGHVGRGNLFTERAAQILNATPVVTTASDAIGTLTVDILGREHGWVLDDMNRNVTRGCAAVVNAERVAFIQEAGEPDFWPLDKALPEGVEYKTQLEDVAPEDYSILLIATDRELAAALPRHWENAVIYRPKTLALGVGCDRDTAPELMQRGVERVLAEQGVSPKCIRCIATVDRKQDEPAIIALSQRYKVPLLTFTAEELDVVAGIENPSDVVKKHVGTRGVSEPAALKASGASQLLMPKRVYTEPGAGRSMTLAIARYPFKKRA